MKLAGKHEPRTHFQQIPVTQVPRIVRKKDLGTGHERFGKAGAYERKLRAVDSGTGKTFQAGA